MRYSLADCVAMQQGMSACRHWQQYLDEAVKVNEDGPIIVTHTALMGRLKPRGGESVALLDSHALDAHDIARGSQGRRAFWGEPPPAG